MNKTVQTAQESSDVLSKKGTCIEFFSAYQEMDIARMLALFSPNAQVYFEPLGDSFSGSVQTIGKGVWSSLMDCFPDLDNTVKETSWNEESKTVTCKVSIFGTQAKDFAGIAAGGLRFDSDHIFIFRFDDQSKIDEARVLWNHERFVDQLTGKI